MKFLLAAFLLFAGTNSNIINNNDMAQSKNKRDLAASVNFATCCTTLSAKIDNTCVNMQYFENYKLDQQNIVSSLQSRLKSSLDAIQYMSNKIQDLSKRFQVIQNHQNQQKLKSSQKDKQSKSCSQKRFFKIKGQYSYIHNQIPEKNDRRYLTSQVQNDKGKNNDCYLIKNEKFYSSNYNYTVLPHSYTLPESPKQQAWVGKIQSFNNYLKQGIISVAPCEGDKTKFMIKCVQIVNNGIHESYLVDNNDGTFSFLYNTTSLSGQKEYCFKKQ